MTRRWAAAAVLATAAAACAPGPKSFPEICETPPDKASYARAEGPGPGPALLRAKRCLHHMAYQLADAEADAETVTQGTLGACLGEVHAAEAEMRRQSGEAAAARITADLDAVARFRVVQARAGRCWRPAP